MNALTFWIDERVEQLKALWARGLTCSQIAAEISNGASRNSIIGKVRRLGLANRPVQPFDPVKANLARKKKRRERAERFAERRLAGRQLSGPRPIKLTTEIPARFSAHPVALDGLTSQTCHWPLWDVAEKSGNYCGGKPLPGLPYCGHHAQLAYQPRR